MFENYTFDYIMKQLLSRVSNTLDKREGSVIYDALAPAAIELVNFYIHLDMVVDESFADTASYAYLAKRAAERGIFPDLATKAILRGVFSPDSLEIKIGERFNLEDLNYVVVKKMEPGQYQLQCEQEGRIGNQRLGALIPIQAIPRLETALLTEILIPGEEVEEEEVFRNRYFASFHSQAFGGNVADYKEKVQAIAGVGAVRVCPVWDGGGTVKLIVLDSDFKKPSQVLVDTVQQKIDPKKDGMGEGIAPIGHIVTVVGVAERVISLETVITYKTGYEFASVKFDLEAAVDAYFEEMAEAWAEQETLIVRVSQIETRLLRVAGVLDIRNTKINGREENLTLSPDEVPIRGEVLG